MSFFRIGLVSLDFWIWFLFGFGLVSFGFFGFGFFRNWIFRLDLWFFFGLDIG